MFTGNFTTELQSTKTIIEQRTELYKHLIKIVMTHIDRQVWRCDPELYKEGTTFEQLSLVRGYIDNEVNISPDNSCLYACRYYNSTQHYRCEKGTLCEKQSSCRGKIVDCKYLDYEQDGCLSVGVEDNVA